MADQDIALMAHLMRRAGFGAARDELEARVAKGYEATVEELLHPEKQPDVDLNLMARYIPEYRELEGIFMDQQAWIYRMINTKRQLQEKMTLFWYGVCPTAYPKVEEAQMLTFYLNMLRRLGLGNYRDFLLELSRKSHNGPLPG